MRIKVSVLRRLIAEDLDSQSKRPNTTQPGLPSNSKSLKDVYPTDDESDQTASNVPQSTTGTNKTSAVAHRKTIPDSRLSSQDKKWLDKGQSDAESEKITQRDKEFFHRGKAEEGEQFAKTLPHDLGKKTSLLQKAKDKLSSLFGRKKKDDLKHKPVEDLSFGDMQQLASELQQARKKSQDYKANIDQIKKKFELANREGDSKRAAFYKKQYQKNWDLWRDAESKVKNSRGAFTYREWNEVLACIDVLNEYKVSLADVLLD